MWEARLRTAPAAKGAGQRRGAGIVLNLFQLAPDRFIHEPAGLDRDHPRAISGADVGFQIFYFHFYAPSLERELRIAASAQRRAINKWQRITLVAYLDPFVVVSIWHARC